MFIYNSKLINIMLYKTFIFNFFFQLKKIFFNTNIGFI
jgi:hypothetical protein